MAEDHEIARDTLCAAMQRVQIMLNQWHSDKYNWGCEQ